MFTRAEAIAFTVVVLELLEYELANSNQTFVCEIRGIRSRKCRTVS